MKPLVYDLYCGLGGWAEGFLAEDYRVVGFDIERHDYGTGGYPGELVLQDIRTLHGAQLRDAAVIVASSPCQEFSYRAMPWKRAKALPPPFLGIDLFWQSFRIQYEASEAAGREIPLVAENVKGAQPWIGRARYHYGSFYLWGHVPCLMPRPSMKAKIPGQDWSRFAKTGEVSPHWNMQALKGMKTVSGPIWFDTGIAAHSSKSLRRKAASAQIAKIPFPLSSYLARVFKPEVIAA